MPQILNLVGVGSVLQEAFVKICSRTFLYPLSTDVPETVLAGTVFISKTLVLVDGDSLVSQFRQLKSSGRRQAQGVIDFKQLVWNQRLTSLAAQFVFRVSYFTTCYGTEPEIEELRRRISRAPYQAGHQLPSGYLVPRVFKRERRSKRSKSVAISIAVEALRHAYSRSVDRIILLSGADDLEHLVQEIMNQGVQVFVGAFSSRSGRSIALVSDQFIELDRHFFG